MAGQLAGRRREMQAIQTLVDQARNGPAALILEGEPGIGKTTLWRAGVELAAANGYTVLTTAGAAAEVSLALAGLADLLAGIDNRVLAGLSPLHRRALHAVISGLGSPGGDERLVATAFLAALEQSCDRQPVLIAVDDAQWLDEASRLTLGFAVRRLDGPVALLAAYGESAALEQTWLQPRTAGTRHRLKLEPMSLGGLHAVIVDRIGDPPSRPAMVRIHTLSGGNPLYAIELARTIGEGNGGEVGALPHTLADVVRRRIGRLDPDTAEAALTVAAAVDPTVDLIAAATGRSPAALVQVLQPLESRGLLSFDGSRIRFAYPLIATSITTDADPAHHRLAHRRLADVVDQPELRARHLALSTPYGDQDTIEALDVAAHAAAERGAYSAAAEFVALAMRAGGDTDMRRLRAAEYNFRAGALDEAENLVAPIADHLPTGFVRALGLMLLAGIRGYRDGMASVTDILVRAVAEAGEQIALRTQGLLLLSLATGLGGNMRACVEYARQARADADSTGIAPLRSQALALWVHVGFMYGLGTDADALRVALEIENPDDAAPATLQPSAVYAMNCAWTGRLHEARTVMAAVARRLEERGNEVDVVWAAEQLTMIDVALGRYDDAERTATGALERALQLGGQLPLITAHTAVASVAAHQGRVEDTELAAHQAIAGATATGLTYLVRPPLMSLAFVQVSGAQYAEALQTLRPLLETFDGEHDTEIMAGGYLADAVESLAALGRTAEADPLVTALQANGARLDRPWMLAVGSRCRALVLAAAGDLDAAQDCAERAMEHHDRLPMPFERARTQLLLGQLQRRRRRMQAAQANLAAAAAVFDEIGSPLWSARAHRESARLAGRSAGSDLSAAERRVAEKAAAGLTNKQTAAALYLSPKTVEMYLSSVYRKLSIRSRAQLADALRRPDPAPEKAPYEPG